MTDNPVMGQSQLRDSTGSDMVYRVLGQIPPSLAYLAEAVRSRRRSLGLNRTDLHEAGGPSDSTMNRIENPTAATSMPRPSTLKRLDVGLQWAPGSASRCLDMRSPEPLEDLVADAAPYTHQIGGGPADKPFSLPAAAAPQGAIDSPVSLEFDAVTVPMDVLNQFFAVYDAYQTGGLDGDSLDDALAIVAQLLGAAHATEVLERMGGPGRQVPPFLTVSLSRYLDPHAYVVAPSGVRIALADQSYRRWLAGFKVADDGDVYRRRWVSKMRGISQ